MSERIRRLEFTELSPDLQAALDARVRRLGYLGEFFRCAGSQPDVLLAFNAMTVALKEALPDRLTEVVALTVAALTGNAYERHQHERLSERLGFGRDWISSVLAGPDNGSEGLAPAEAAVQRLAVSMVARDGDGAQLLERVVDHVGPERAVALLFLVGRYWTHASIVNTLALEPPVPSIFGADAA